MLLDEKLRAEINQLETEETNAAGPRGLLTAVAAPLTGLAAIATIFVSLIGFRRERREQREQQATSEEQHLDDRFSSVLLGLGSDSEAIQAGSAVSLLTFLSDQNRRFRRQVRWAALANLKVEHVPPVRKLLVIAFEEVLRTDEPTDTVELDLSHAFLSGATLQSIVLDRAKLDQVDLSDADLSNCRLRSVKGRQACLANARICGAAADLFNARLPAVDAPRVNFGGANLVNAHLEEGNFRGASFRGARMQAAHLERTQLQEARFDGASLADCYFLDAKFDSPSLESLSKVDTWEKAHFSPDIESKLKSLQAQNSNSGPTKG